MCCSAVLCGAPRRRRHSFTHTRRTHALGKLCGRLQSPASSSASAPDGASDALDGVAPSTRFLTLNSSSCGDACYNVRPWHMCAMHPLRTTLFEPSTSWFLSSRILRSWSASELCDAAMRAAMYRRTAVSRSGCRGAARAAAQPAPGTNHELHFQLPQILCALLGIAAGLLREFHEPTCRRRGRRAGGGGGGAQLR